MLERKAVKEGLEYRIDGEPWFVWMIHKSGNGEAVTLTSEGYGDAFYERLRTGAMHKMYMQMRKFQKAATLAPNAAMTGPEGVQVDEPVLPNL